MGYRPRFTQVSSGPGLRFIGHGDCSATEVALVRWFALLGLLGLLRLQPIEEVSHPVSVPERTRVEARPGWPAPLPAPTPVAVEREVLRVGVYLGGRVGWHPQRGVGVEAPHYDYLPGPDAGWPDLHSADLLQDWIRGSDDLIYSAFLEAAEQEGPGWPDAPEGVVSRLVDPPTGKLAAPGAEGARRDNHCARRTLESRRRQWRRRRRRAHGCASRPPSRRR